MEDILASIRRIIADDQNGAVKPASPANVAPRPAGGEGERAVTRARTPYDDVLDLARLVPTAERGVTPPVRAVATAQPANTDQQEMDRTSDHGEARGDRTDGAASGLRARLPEPMSFGQAREEDHDMLDHSVAAIGDDADGDLLSPPLGDSVMSAFETLAATVVLQNTPMLERVMRDLLRPMLKTWLDDNLPGLVERLVRTEIERVARGSRG